MNAQPAREQLDGMVRSVGIGLAMVALLFVLGYLVLGFDGLLIFGIGGVAVYAVAAQRLNDVRVAANRLPYGMAPDLYAALETLAVRAHLPRVPQLAYLPSPALNAFTIGGRDRSAIVVTAGLLRGLSYRQVVAVMAHEVAHIRNNDSRLLMVAGLLQAATALLARFGWLVAFLTLPALLFGYAPFPPIALPLLVAAPFVGVLLQRALMRTREFEADIGAVELTGDPEALASALERVEAPQRSWVERVFQLPFPYRVGGGPGSRRPGGRWGYDHSGGANHQPPGIEPAASDPLRTHPTTAERVRRLRSVGYGRYQFGRSGVGGDLFGIFASGNHAGNFLAP